MMLKSVNIEYLLIRGEDSKLWSTWRDVPGVEAQGCFPGVQNTPWRHTVCVAHLEGFTGQPEIQYDFGWSHEPWGSWTIDERPHAEFFSSGDGALKLVMEAFPQCDLGQLQSIRVLFNGETIGEGEWTSACETQQFVMPISAEQNQPGWNSIDFRFAYAISPSEVDPTNNDPRTLAVGFNRIELIAMEP